ncbi:MAG: 2-C-methyl-D-erythritol 4-phosphate cytidylyltransferase [Syntrophomonadaceae bacterium]|jgi:2-C-methyl-D-erythritol 4-phosphate cytidylyltransferase
MDNNLRVVIAAAGSGRRMGQEINKQYRLLLSRPVLAYSIDVFEVYPQVDEIVVVAHPDEIDYCKREVIKRYGYKKVSRVIAGGAERQDSVWKGLQSLGTDTAYVAVHDGARPLLSSQLIDHLLEAAREWGAAIPGVMARDTLKMIDRDGFVGHTLDRSVVSLIQTPQIFQYQELLRAYEYAYRDDLMGTDDASLFEVYIGRVKVVPGEANNIKMTTMEDMLMAEALLRMSRS